MGLRIEPEKGLTMRIKFLKAGTPAGFGYVENERADLPEATARKLIADGYAVEDANKDGGEVQTRESKQVPEIRGGKKK